MAVYTNEIAVNKIGTCQHFLLIKSVDDTDPFLLLIQTDAFCSSSFFHHSLSLFENIITIPSYPSHVHDMVSFLLRTASSNIALVQLSDPPSVPLISSPRPFSQPVGLVFIRIFHPFEKLYEILSLSTLSVNGRASKGLPLAWREK